MQEHLRIEDPETARVLTDARTARLLPPFMKRPHSLSDAAHELDVKLPMLSYHVKRFLELGILTVVGTERRSGRSVKLYSGTAKTFIVPFHATRSETLEKLIIELTAPDARLFQRELARALQRLAPDWGVYLVCNDAQEVSFSLKPDLGVSQREIAFTDGPLGPHDPALISNYGRIHLDFDTAKTFQRDLDELYTRYMKLSDDKGQTYAFQLGLTPIEDKNPE